ncbi:uncharacterized protein cracdla [Xenentodon cancila]
METFSGNTEEAAEDFLGCKKSRIKSMKSRLFWRSKKADTEETAKLSQSASDITAGKGPGSDEDLVCSQGMMGSRALSHDSIFLAEDPADSEPTRILSQENVHSKIKALQMKLQLQKMHLGPPPMVLPIRCHEEPSSRSEDSLLQSSHDTSGEVITLQETLTQATSQPASCLFSPILKASQTKSLPPTPSHPTSLSVLQTSSASTVEAPLDFSAPVQFSTCLDTSAARHRMSVKPRNRRVITKEKPSTVTLPSVSSIGLPESAKDREQQLFALESEMQKTDKAGDSTLSHPPVKSSAVSPVTLDPEPKSPNQSVLHQDRAFPATVASQALRVKPPMRTNTVTRERPHSSFIESELRQRREVDFGKQVMFLDKKTTPNKSAMPETSLDQLSNAINTAAASRSSSSQLWPQGEGESRKGIKRPAPGTGSFKFSVSTVKTQDEERPRAISFAGVLEQTEARQKAVGGTEEKSVREKEEPTSSQARGSAFAVGRLRQEGEPSRSSVSPQDKKDALKTTEPEPSKSLPTDTGAVEAEEMESSQELVEEAEEAKEVQEDEGKTAFGVKLRTTTQSLKYQSETSSNRHSRTRQLEDQGDKQKRQEVSNNVSRMSEKLAASSSSVLKPADPAPSGISLPAKHNTPPTDSPHSVLTEVQKISSNLKETQTTPLEPQPAPQTSASEVSWMSLAMEKTRSLQQLFSSRFPRDFTGTQTSARTQARVQPSSQPETTPGAHTPMEKSPTRMQAAIHPPADAVKEESVQSRSQVQTVKPSSVAAQQKMTVTSPVQPNNSKESQTSKQTKEEQSQPSTTQPVSQSPSHPALRANPRTAQSPLHSSSQAATTSSSAQGNAAPSLAQSHISSGQQQQQPSWTSRCLQQATQLKSTTSAPTAASPVSGASTSDSASERGEREASMQREGPSQSIRRAVWSGSVGERAAFLEKRTEWNSSPSLKGVELKTSQTELQTSWESPSPAKTTPPGKDTLAEGRHGLKPAESNPKTVPEAPREDRWIRKNMGSLSSPSSSPTQPSVLQSMSESGQPSWMELAKRKSMAWSDKTMD